MTRNQPCTPTAPNIHLAKFIVECVATFFLVLIIGVASVLGVAGHMAPLAVGLTLVALVYMGGHVSMAHYNPAITLSFFIHGRCPGREVLPYLVAQFVGAVLAAFAFKALYPRDK